MLQMQKRRTQRGGRGGGGRKKKVIWPPRGLKVLKEARSWCYKDEISLGLFNWFVVLVELAVYVDQLV